MTRVAKDSFFGGGDGPLSEGVPGGNPHFQQYSPIERTIQLKSDGQEMKHLEEGDE